MSKRKILLIEDGPVEQQDLDEVLRGEGYDVETLSDPATAFASVESWAKQYHLVIVEEAMRGHTGMQLLYEARKCRRDLPVVVVTRDGNWGGYIEALSAGAVSYIPQPIDEAEFLGAVRAAMQ